MNQESNEITLWGVGVGPGASDLLTLRALQTLRDAPVLAIPRANRHRPSLAWRIVKPHLEDMEGQERLDLIFPMTKDPEILKPAWAEAIEAIGSHLSAGRSVAFITQGDPMIYSTFNYLADDIAERWPHVKIRWVPAVTSISAVPATLGLPLADGQERIAIVPVTYGVDDLRDIIQKFDSIVLMKVTKQLPTILEALEAENLLDRAYYVERATTDQQRIVRDITSLKDDKCVYFSMIIIAKKQRSGVLAGDRPLTAGTQEQLAGVRP
jgi:precorrin-2/cobalt-factor-2 C20-methyltransferase